jgi:uncharacterized protein (DUF427 family)
MTSLSECVWDYPRPPRIEPNNRHLLVVHGDRTLAETRSGYRVLETSHPPCFYLPPDAVDWTRLVESSTVTFCEFKGRARYWSLQIDSGVIPDICWSYPEPMDSQSVIAGFVSFYAGRVDACYVDGERVQAQAGSYYGGWITSGIEGPFKGGPGTAGW